ncbi:MAG: radical SAM protein [Candidatus Omnitrophota bacterium]
MKKWNDGFSLPSHFSLAHAYGSGRRYGIPREILEYFPVTAGVSSGDDTAKDCVTDITLNLTSRCNLKCLYCWNDRGKYSNRAFSKVKGRRVKAAASSGEMSSRVAFKAVDMLVDMRGDDNDLVVDFYGGEPLLNTKTLFAAVEYCRGNQKRWGVNFHFLLATNGTLLTPALAKKLIDSGVQIAVSVDGRKKVHDNNRPFVTGKGSFNKIASNLKNMPDGIMKRLVGRATVTPFCSDMPALYSDLKRLGFERVELFESEDACHRITPSRERYFFNTPEQRAILRREYEKLARCYIKDTLAGSLDYRKTFFNRFFKLMQRLYYSHEVTGGCPAARGQFAVTAEGDIYPCTSFLGIEDFRLGNVLSGLDKRAYRAFTRKIKGRFLHCGECELFALCRTTGSCLNINYYFNGDPAVPYDRSCELFREKLELAAAALAILSEHIPDRLEELFGFDAVGRRGNKLY